MLEKYIFISSVYVAIIDAQIVGVLALLPIDETLIEIKISLFWKPIKAEELVKNCWNMPFQKREKKGFKTSKLEPPIQALGNWLCTKKWVLKWTVFLNLFLFTKKLI